MCVCSNAIASSEHPVQLKGWTSAAYVAPLGPVLLKCPNKCHGTLLGRFRMFLRVLLLGWLGALRQRRRFHGTSFSTRCLACQQAGHLLFPRLARKAGFCRKRHIMMIPPPVVRHTEQHPRSFSPYWTPEREKDGNAVSPQLA